MEFTPHLLMKRLIVHLLVLNDGLFFFLDDLLNGLCHVIFIVVMVVVVVVMMVVVIVMIVVVIVMMVVIIVVVVVIMVIVVIVVVSMVMVVTTDWSIVAMIRFALHGNNLGFHGKFHNALYDAFYDRFYYRCYHGFILTGRRCGRGRGSSGGGITVVPVCRALLPSETFVVISLGGEKLLEVGFAKVISGHASVVTQAENHLAVFAAQTTLVEHLLVLFVLYHHSLGDVYGFAALVALFGR